MKEGAPPGWYKVCVYYDVPQNPSDFYSATKSLIHRKYKDPHTTDLSAEVVADAPAGTYDLKLKSSPR